jgi:hypothetical protein
VYGVVATLSSPCRIPLSFFVQACVEERHSSTLRSLFLPIVRDAKAIYQEEMDLMYHLRQQYSEVEQMPVFERGIFIRMLVEQKERETEAMKGTGGRENLLAPPIDQQATHGMTDKDRMTTSMERIRATSRSARPIRTRGPRDAPATKPRR